MPRNPPAGRDPFVPKPEAQSRSPPSSSRSTFAGPAMVTFTPATPSPRRSLTWMPSVPWLLPNAATGGATRLDILIGAIGVLMRLDDVVDVIRM